MNGWLQPPAQILEQQLQTLGTLLLLMLLLLLLFFAQTKELPIHKSKSKKKRREWREREPKKQERNHCHGPRTGCIAQSIDPGPYDTIKDKGTEGKTQRPSRHIGVNVLKSQRKELLPGIHRWRRRINVLSQKKSKSWITWLYRAICLLVRTAIMCGCRRLIFQCYLWPIVLAQLWMTPQYTHTRSGGIWTPKEACRVLPLAICLDSCSCSCFCAWIRLLSWPFAQVSCLFMLRYPVNASALWPLSVSALSPVILPGVASLCLFFRSFS